MRVCVRRLVQDDYGEAAAERADEAFDRLDADGSGALDLKEFSNAVELDRAGGVRLKDISTGGRKANRPQGKLAPVRQPAGRRGGGSASGGRTAQRSEPATRGPSGAGGAAACGGYAPAGACSLYGGSPVLTPPLPANAAYQAAAYYQQQTPQYLLAAAQAWQQAQQQAHQQQMAAALLQQQQQQLPFGTGLYY